MIERLSVQLAEALTLFLVVNWIGRHSYGRGYMSMELLPRPDEAPAVNAAIRVATPIVFLVLASAALYTFGLDSWVESSYMVAVLYVGFRWTFNVAWGRARLVNWAKEFFFATLIVGGATLLDRYVISKRINVLPDPSNLANEMWVLILAFLFYVANQIRTSEASTERRKHNYILHRAKTFRNRYRFELAATQNEAVLSVILAVMIYEEFNRPLIARSVENVAFRFGRAKTLGLMQVTTREMINDRESVRRGVARLVSTWTKHSNNPYGDWTIQREMIKDYNQDDDYISEVSSIAAIIIEGLYPKTTSKLSTYEPLVNSNEPAITAG